jgi:hypothetical protein
VTYARVAYQVEVIMAYDRIVGALSNSIRGGSEDFATAKAGAEVMRAERGLHYNIEKIEIVWTTMTLKEAIGNDG